MTISNISDLCIAYYRFILFFFLLFFIKPTKQKKKEPKMITMHKRILNEIKEANADEDAHTKVECPNSANLCKLS